MDFKFNCPNCAQHFTAPDEMAGERVDCPTCGNGFMIPAAPIPPIELLRFTCSKCLVPIEMSPIARVDIMECPNCGEIIQPPRMKFEWTSGMPGYIQVVEAHLENARSRLKAATGKGMKKAIRDEISDLVSALKDERECIAEDARDAREEAKARLQSLHCAMGPEGNWGEFIKRPTLAQVKECVAELDLKGQWDEEVCSDLLDILLVKYPALAR